MLAGVVVSTRIASHLVEVTVVLLTGGEVHCFAGEGSRAGQGDSLRPAVHRKGKMKKRFAL